MDKPKDMSEIFGEGHRLGAFQIERLLGSGGFAEVYLARNTILDREVAIKVVRTIDAENMEQQGARIMCRLDHPNIVRVYFADRIDGRLAIAMDYIRGATLKQVLDEKAPLDSSAALAIVSAIAGALDYVHSFRSEQFSGIAHLDLKPSNILVDEEGRIKIADFGMAQLLSNAANPEMRIGGSPTYMAPEQYSGKPCPQSDLWAVGVLLFRMIAGQAPFRASSKEDYRRQVCEYNPESDDRLASFPTEIRALISRCLQRDLSRRFASAHELREALEAISSGSGTRECPNCGSILPEDSALCPECTYEETPKQMQTAPWLNDRLIKKKKATHRRLLVWIGLPGIVLVLGFGYAGYRFRQKWRTVPPAFQTIDSSRLEQLKRARVGWVAVNNLEASHDGIYEDRIRALKEFTAAYPDSAEAKEAVKRLAVWEAEGSRFLEATEAENQPDARICQKLAKWTEFYKTQQTKFRQAFAWERMQHWQKEVDNYTGYAELTIKSATGLPPSDNELLGGAQPDPFFVLIQNGKALYRSRTSKNNPSPVWGEKVRVLIRPSEDLIFEIRDEDPISYDLLMHQILSPLPIDCNFRKSLGAIEVEMEILRER